MLPLVGVEEFLAFLDEFPDEERGFLCCESRDWDRLIPILCTFAFVVENGHLRGRDFGSVLRALSEIAYTMGYQRGQREARREPLSFVVGSAEDQG